MPGEAGAAGIITVFDFAPSNATVTGPEPDVFASSGITATILFSDSRRTAMALPFNSSCACGPKPDPRAAMVSPGERAPAARLAKLTTESRRGAGAGGNAILLTN